MMELATDGAAKARGRTHIARRALSWIVHAAVLVIVVAASARLASVLNAPAIKRGEAAPSSTGHSLSGEPFALRTLSGRPVLLNFWATWCPPCRYELPALAAAAASAHPHVQFVGVVMNDDEGAARMLANADVQYLNVRLDPSSLAAWRIESVPSSILLDEDHRVVWARSGIVDEDDIDDAIAAHLGVAGRQEVTR